MHLWLRRVFNISEWIIHKELNQMYTIEWSSFRVPLPSNKPQKSQLIQGSPKSIN